MQAALLQGQKALVRALGVAVVRLALHRGVQRGREPLQQRLDVRQALAVRGAQDVRQAPRVGETVQLTGLAVASVHERHVLELVHHLLVRDAPHVPARAVRGMRAERGGHEEVRVRGQTRERVQPAQRLEKRGSQVGLVFPEVPFTHAAFHLDGVLRLLGRGRHRERRARSLSTSSTEAAVASGGDTRGPHSTPRVYGAPPPSTRAPRSLAVNVRSTRVRRKRWRTPRTA
jgi:hypothetical protein